MKKIEAVIRAEKFPDVDKALKELGAYEPAFGIFKREMSREEVVIRRSVFPEAESEYIQGVKIVIVANGVEMPRVVETIANTAGTGQAGDGRISVSTVENVVDIDSETSGLTVLATSLK